MIKNDFRGKAVLITGGTKGIGLSIALAFAREGAQAYLTYKWGTASHDAVRNAFTKEGLLEPILIEADASIDDDTNAILEKIKEKHDGIEVFVSNVSFAQIVQDMGAYKKRSFLKSLEYSAWPFLGYSKRIKEFFGSYPRYILATSSDGPDTYCVGYDFVAVSKTVMETFCRYMAKHLFNEGVRVNVLRARPVSTDSLRATFGDDFEPFVKKYHGEEFFITVDEVGDAALAMCSGLMDAMTGQVLMLDRGVAFHDNIMHLFENRDELGLSLLLEDAE
ncbi:MAG: SDR family oxidoreductase [Myxococcales bacterium]|nr:SDR family oxidoreductase [Myxococcales bacterium]